MLRTHTFSGEKQAGELIEWLNSKRPGRNVLVRLLDDIQSITRPSARAAQKEQQDRREGEGYLATVEDGGKLITGHVARLGVGKHPPVTIDIPRVGKRQISLTDDRLAIEQNKTLMRINAVLSRFKRCAQLAFQVDDRWMVTSSFTGGDVALAVHSMMELAEEGLLHRVRRCRACKRWFFARFRHQDFCSQACQQKHYRSSDEWKAHRREYMRKHYADSAWR